VDPSSRRLANLTVEVAVRLIRTRLRQHILAKVKEVVRRHREDETGGYDLVLDVEKSTEASALGAWLTVVGLWNDGKHDETKKPLRAYVSHAVAMAVGTSTSFIQETRDEWPNEDVKAWILEFVDGFDAGEFAAGTTKSVQRADSF
jgi:hypothetical protein